MALTTYYLDKRVLKTPVNGGNLAQLKAYLELPAYILEVIEDGGIASVGLTVPTGFSVANSPLIESGTLVVTNTFTAGSVVFAMGTGFAQDNANFFWNDSTNRLGLLTALPTATFSVAELFKVDSIGNAYFVNDTQFISMNDIKIHGYGANNFFAGKNSGNFTLTSSACIGIGENTGLALTSGTGNVFIGRQVGQNVTIGTDNVIIGKLAGDDLITGSRNIVIGDATDVTPYATSTSDSINIGNTIFGDRVARSIKLSTVTVAGSHTQANASSILELESVTKGFLPPKMTTVQKNAISSPVAGLMLHDTTSTRLNYYTGSAWREIEQCYSGTYTPTLFNVTNIDASTAYVCQYMRVGNVVTVSGKVDIDQTAAVAYELGLSLPIASNFSASEQCAGTAVGVTAADDALWILGDTTNDRASFQAAATSTSNHSHYFTFTYQII